MGLGQSEDDGDSDDLAPYVYGGVGRDFDGFGMPMTGQIVLVASDDEYGETIQYAAFIDVATAFELSGDLSATVGGSMLYGARWNDSDPSDGTVFIGELRLGLDYTPGDGPISYYAEVLRTDFHTTEESNSPYVDEFRIGMRYALGGTTRAALPNVGRWVSVSVNEIE